MMTRDQIIAAHPLERELPARGIALQKRGLELWGVCPLHADSSPSLRVNVGKQAWFCDPCNKGGSIIDFLILADGLSEAEAFKRLTEGMEEREPQHGNGNGHRKIVATYTYTDETGREIFQVVRFEPKNFLQRRMVGGKWVWNMDGITRVLYNLPAVAAADMVWIVEGEKDCETLRAGKLVATTNAGGAGKWLDGYSDSLAGKDVILVPDKDTSGKGDEHMRKVMDSLAGKVKTARWVNLPKSHKDATDFVCSFADKTDGLRALINLAEAAAAVRGAVDLPIKSMEELEHEYKEFIKRAETQVLDLGKWLPTLGRMVRGIIPGEVVTVLAETGVGKTYALQNIARSANLVTVMFELELPGTLTFERYCALLHNVTGERVWATYKSGAEMSHAALRDIYVCSESFMTLERMHELITKAELKIGSKPVLVLVDYAQLVTARSVSRYERISHVAEGIKALAKSTNTIIVLASQVSRDSNRTEIGINDGKDSGSLENSCGVMLGMWRDLEEDMGAHIKVLKNTKGRPHREGESIRCWLDKSMNIMECPREAGIEI